MFNTPTRVDKSFDEGTVIEVDSIRKKCKVKTLYGRNLDSVTWLQPSGGASRGGDRVTPFLGDRVIVHTGLGYPIIIGFLPRLQSAENVFPASIDTGEVLIDTGNLSEGGSSIIGDQNSARDIIAGDRVINSPGGGLVSLLRGGSVLLRSSRLAEVYLSKWDDLVRVVSRNWSHFTDVNSDMIRNLKGRIYRYTGYSNLFKESKVEDYKYHQYIGDVALAELTKTGELDPDNLPDISSIIYKEQITTDSGGQAKELLRREIHLDGTHDLVVRNADGSIFTRIKHTNGEVVITYKDLNVITINADKISSAKGGDNNLIVQDDSGIRATFNDARINMYSGGIDSTFGGHFVKISAGGVALG